MVKFFILVASLLFSGFSAESGGVSIVEFSSDASNQSADLLKVCSDTNGVVLRWRQVVGDRFLVRTFAREKIYINGRYSKTSDIMNKAILTTTTKLSNWVLLTGDFYSYEKTVDLRESYHLENIYKSRFWRDPQGRVKVHGLYLMPVSRGIPFFPEYPLTNGQEWFAPADEIHELGFSTRRIVKLPLIAHYKYLGVDDRDGKKLHRIEIDFHTTKIFPVGDELQSFSGQSEMVYLWNDDGYPDSYTERFSFVITLSDGRSVRYDGNAYGTVRKITNENEKKKEQMKKDIEELVKRNDFPAKVKKTPRGVVIEMSSILFDFNSDKVKRRYRKMLREIAYLLRAKGKKYDVEVAGYTDNVGPEDYNLKLSEKRAKNVADLLVKYGLSPDRVSYIGFGEENPVASNETEEGRRLNRRVEITVIMNEVPQSR